MKVLKIRNNVVFYFEASLWECSSCGGGGASVSFGNCNSDSSFAPLMYVMGTFSHTESISLINIFFNVGSLHVTNWNHVFAKVSGKAQPLNCTGSTCHCRDTSHFITLSLCIPWHFIDILQALVPRFLCFFSMVPIKGSNTQQLLQELIAFFQGTITSLFE